MTRWGVDVNSSVAIEETGGKGFDKVVAFLREGMLDGTIRAGDRLASERELTLRLGVSRPILREALRAMAMIGVVEIRERIGTIVRRPDVSVLGDFFTFALAQQSEMVDDVMQARIAIECQAIRLACRRAGVSDFERLREALDRIVATIDDPDGGGQADFDFHSAIVRAGKSDTLTTLHQAMGELLKRSHRERRELVRVFDELKSYLIEDHGRIFQAIMARDEDKADLVLRNHFRIGDEYRQRALEARR